MRIDELPETAEDVIERARYSLSSPVAEFASLIDKGGFAMAVLGRTVWTVAVVTVAAGAVAFAATVGHGTPSLDVALATVRDSASYRAVVAVLVLLNLRQILFRIRDREVTR